MPIDRTKITKEDIAKGYDAIAEKVYVSEDFYNEVLDINPAYFGDILEVGVGRGVVLKNIAQRGGKQIKSLTGVDLSDRLIEIAKKNVPEAKILKGDAEALPFLNKFFDFVVMVDTFQYLLNFDKALEEVRRVLRPEGKFIVTVPNKKWILFKDYIRQRKNIQPVEDHFFDYAEMVGLLKKHGLEILKYCGADALRFYGKKHRLERMLANLIPPLNKYMKKIIFLCKVTK